MHFNSFRSSISPEHFGYRFDEFAESVKYIPFLPLAIYAVYHSWLHWSWQYLWNNAAIELQESYEEAAEQARDPQKQDEITKKVSTNQLTCWLKEQKRTGWEGNDDSK